MTDQDPTVRYQPTKPGQTTDPAPAGAPDVTAAPPPPPAVAPPPGVPSFAPAPTTRVARTSQTRPGGSRARWLVALAVTVLVASATLVATAALTASETTSDASAWTPANTVSYAELRLDLPGSQASELPRFMAAFPGFADQAAFGTKLEEVFDQLIRRATNDSHNFRSEIEPWFDGQVAVAQRAPSASSGSDAAGPHALLLVRVKNPDAAQAWVESILTESGALASPPDTYNGTPIHVLTTSSSVGSMPSRIGYAIVGDLLIVGDLDSIQSSIDTGGTTGLAADAQFQTAVEALPGDRLALVYSDAASALASMRDSLGSVGAAMGSDAVSALLDVYEALTPGWSAMSVRADNGALVADTVSQHVAALGEPANATSDLAAVVPADTLLLVTGRDLGDRLAVIRRAIADKPPLADGVRQVDQALALLGGFDAVTGWMGESGVAIVPHGDSVTGGVLIHPDDPAAAERVLTTIRGLASLGLGDKITFTEEPYDGTTIVSVDLANLAGLAGSRLSLPSNLPSGLSLAWAATDKVVVLGLGTDFVKAVLDTQAGGASLASEPRFSDGLSRAGSSNSGLVWVDITGLRQVAEPLLPGSSATSYDADIKPYVEPLDAIIGASVAGTDVDRSTFVLTVNH
jgi:hypothetical protein